MVNVKSESTQNDIDAIFGYILADLCSTELKDTVEQIIGEDTNGL